MGVMKYVFGGGLLLVVLILLLSMVEFPGEKERVAATKAALEKAYFEGQKDALEGDIRIKKDANDTYQWVKSPWD